MSNSERLLRSKCYSGIDELPIYNWFELFKTNNLFNLLRVKKAVPKKQLPTLKKLFEEMYDAYLKEFGVGEKMNEILELKKQIIENTNKYIQGDTGALTFIDIDEDKLQKHTAETTTEKQSIWELKSRMEVALKISIDVKKCTVVEFYSYLKIINELHNQAA